MLPNLWLLAQMLFKVSLLTGLGPGIVAVIFLTRYPAAAGQIARSLLAVRRFWQRLSQQIAEATNGNRVGQTRTAQRRVNDLTNTGAPWVGMEAPQVIEISSWAGVRRRVAHIGTYKGADRPSFSTQFEPRSRAVGWGPALPPVRSRR